MSNFIKVELLDSCHRYEYINLMFVYAIESDNGHCKLIMADKGDCLLLNESIESFLSRIHCGEQR